MTREEARLIVRIIADTYSNFKPVDLSETVTTWAAIFSDDSYEAIKAGLYTYIRTDHSGFAPSPGQILDSLHSVLQPELGEGKVWAMVSRAISNSGYHAAEEYDALPAAVRRAVGSASQLHAWAVDEDLSMSVVQSQVLKAYRQVKEQERSMAAISPEIMRLIGDGTKKIAGRINNV